jgi:hypothetical protein
MIEDLWICGRLTHGYQESGSPWEFQGVFSSEEKAVEACRDWSYFIFTAALDEALPHETCFPKQCYYPFKGGPEE